MITYINIQKTESGGTPEVVDLASAKAWLQIDFADFDSLITSMITGARQTIEGFTNLVLVDNDVEIDVEITNNADQIILPYTYKVDSTTLKVKDADGNTVDPLFYKLRGNVLQMISMIGVFNITYTITNDSIPQALKEAIKMELAERFANRGENQAMRANYDSPSLGISEAAKAKAFPYQMIWM